MDKLIELLPLYAELQGHPKIEIIKHYARANMAPLLAENERMKNMALMQAARASAAERETEALRAEVERLKVVAHGFVDEIALKDRRAEQLEDALRGWWEARRPVSWTEDQHRSCPHVNLATDAEEALATALLRDHDSKYEHEEDTNDR